MNIKYPVGKIHWDFTEMHFNRTKEKQNPRIKHQTKEVSTKYYKSFRSTRLLEFI